MQHVPGPVPNGPGPRDPQEDLPQGGRRHPPAERQHRAGPARGRSQIAQHPQPTLQPGHPELHTAVAAERPDRWLLRPAHCLDRRRLAQLV